MRCCLKKSLCTVVARRTDEDRSQSSPWAFGSGELKPPFWHQNRGLGTYVLRHGCLIEHRFGLNLFIAPPKLPDLSKANSPFLTSKLCTVHLIKQIQYSAQVFTCWSVLLIRRYTFLASRHGGEPVFIWNSGALHVSIEHWEIPFSISMLLWQVRMDELDSFFFWRLFIHPQQMYCMQCSLLTMRGYLFEQAAKIANDFPKKKVDFHNWPNSLVISGWKLDDTEILINEYPTRINLIIGEKEDSQMSS